MSFVQTKAFVKDLSKAKMSDKHLARFIEYLHILSEQKALPAAAKDHLIKGEWNDFREFHISGDLLVIYQVENKIIKLARLGTHSQLFKG